MESYKETVKELAGILLPNFHNLIEYNILFREDNLHQELLSDTAYNFFCDINELYFSRFY